LLFDRQQWLLYISLILLDNLSFCFTFDHNIYHTIFIAAYQKAIEINPEKEEAYLNMGYVYDSLKKYKEAIVAYQKAIEINPENDGVY